MNTTDYMIKRTFFRPGDVVKTEDGRVMVYHSNQGSGMNIIHPLDGTSADTEGYSGKLKFAPGFDPGMVHTVKNVSKGEVLVIWWLDQHAAETAYKSEAKESLPEYIKDELYSLLGRAGRGRLWVSPELDLKSIEWNYASPNSGYCSNAAGLVMREDDMQKAAELGSGIFTDLNLISIP